ncbi:MAG: phospholipase D-like domain-containing protein [Halomonas subglaciescola]|nr:phospholipase D-like domain-containing protein [Halomonas subglaciescola]
MLLVLILLLAAWLAMGLWQRYKPLPEGVDVAWPMRQADNVRLLSDETWYDAEGKSHQRQMIFDEVLGMIAQARRLIVLDMFLFNDFAGQADNAGMRALSSELSEALIKQKRRHPDMTVQVITDPINTLYGALMPEHLARLQDAGVALVISDLDRLRASNPLWSGLWHLGLNRLGNDQGGGWLPNPMGPDRVTLRSYLSIANVRANHRKTLVVDHGDGWAGLITSANPHDASSRHDNVALRFEGPAALDLLASERALIDWSRSAGDDNKDEDEDEDEEESEKASKPRVDDKTQGSAADERLRILSEAAIRDALLSRITRSDDGERLDIAVFYLSHRPLIEALKAAHARGVAVRVLLDPNREAFGMKKGGIPNRPVAAELAEAGIEVRWCLTQGEQCHTKLLLHRKRAGQGAAMILGSANYTRRNLDNLNLETSVELVGTLRTPAINEAAELFERQWLSRDAHRTSVALSAGGEASQWAHWRYRLMEASGLSTF